MTDIYKESMKKRHCAVARIVSGCLCVLCAMALHSRFAGIGSAYAQAAPEAVPAEQKSATGEAPSIPPEKKQQEFQKAGAATKRIAAIAFVNQTGSEDYRLWSENLPAIIMSAMKERFDFTEVKGVTPDQAKSIDPEYPDRGVLRATAEKIGADILLFGLYTLDTRNKALMVSAAVYHAPLDEVTPPFQATIRTNSTMFVAITVEAERITANIGIPYPPVNLVASRGDRPDRIDLSWEPSKSASGYRVYRGARDGSGLVEIGATSVAYFEDRDCPPGKVSSYRIRAYSKYGLSNYSVPARGYRKIMPPAIEVGEGKNNSVRVSWKAVEGASGYQIYRSDNRGGSYEKIADTAENEYLDRPERAGMRYWYKVKTVNEAGAGDFSDDASHFVAKPLLPYYARGLVPGWGQIYAGNTNKGWAIAGGFAVLAAGGAYYGWKYYSSKKEYDSLSSTSSTDEFDAAYDRYERNARIANIFIGAAALVYIYNWVDLIFFSRADYERGDQLQAPPSSRLSLLMDRYVIGWEPVTAMGLTWRF